MFLEQLTSRARAFSPGEANTMVREKMGGLMAEMTNESEAIKKLENYLKVRGETIQAWDEMKGQGFDKQGGAYQQWREKKAELSAIFESFPAALRKELTSLENWGRDAGIKELRRVLDSYKAEDLAREMKKAA